MMSNQTIGIDPELLTSEKFEAPVTRRRDSWDNPVEDKKSPGIGKLKIPPAMREKLEAVTSSHSSR